MPSSAACAYLVTAAVIAAGLDGLRQELPLPPPGQSAADGAAPLPTDLAASLLALKADVVLCDALGEELVRWFVGVKEAEMATIAQRIATPPEDLKHSTAEQCILSAWRHMYLEFL
mmetsp:Transcript_35865/g.78825  ORF Transcript_35865/g.78825 Transcript_35865/m.78825 type:complete len:116 (-) Transcript_35865:463-810(-)